MRFIITKMVKEAPNTYFRKFYAAKQEVDHEKLQLSERQPFGLLSGTPESGGIATLTFQ